MNFCVSAPTLSPASSGVTPGSSETLLPLSPVPPGQSPTGHKMQEKSHRLGIQGPGFLPQLPTLYAEAPEQGLQG